MTTYYKKLAQMGVLSCLFLSFSLQAFEVVDGKVKAFNRENFPLSSFIQESAKALSMAISYNQREVRNNDVVTIASNQELTLSEFKDLFLESLGDFNLTVRKTAIGWDLINASDSRYEFGELYTDQSFPKNKQYITYIHRLKFPLASEFTRSIRAFLSRYGRVFELGDGKTIVLHDYGVQVDYLIKIAQSFDTEETYERALKMRRERNERTEEKGSLKKAFETKDNKEKNDSASKS